MGYPHYSDDCAEHHDVVGDGPTAKVLNDIAAERFAQEEKWGEQNHPDGTGASGARDLAIMLRQICQAAPQSSEGDTWAKILAEEVGESFAEVGPADLRVELIQVAAVAANWAEAIDRRQARAGAA